MTRKTETCETQEFFELIDDLDFRDELIESLYSYADAKTCTVVEYEVDSLGRIDSESSPRPLSPEDQIMAAMARSEKYRGTTLAATRVEICRKNENGGLSNLDMILFADRLNALCDSIEAFDSMEGEDN